MKKKRKFATKIEEEKSLIVDLEISKSHQKLTQLVCQITNMGQSKKDEGVIAIREFKDLVFQQLDRISCQLILITSSQLLLIDQALKQVETFKH
jgi:hypothetical protein